jgi:hypothetical protein
MKGAGKGFPRTAALVSALIGCLVLPASAAAVTRYAAPGGTADDTVCVTPDAAKCSIGAAAGGPDVLPADEAVILPGDYSDTAGDLNGDMGNPTDGVVQPLAGNVHGASGEPKPVITVNGLDSMFANPYGAFLLSATTLSDVEINAGAMASGAVTFGFGSANSIVQRVVARTTRDGAITCNQSQGTIRDSVCLSSGSGGIGLGASSAIAGTYTDNVRNVTAIATGSNSFGVDYFYGTFSPPGPTYTISAKSLIAQGTSQDIRVRTSGTGTSVTMTLDHSDYDAALAAPGTGGAASVTAPGTGTGNITSAPMLGTDGYHQLAGSPTINAGAVDGSSGTTDIDRQARTIDSTPDIGADELAFPTSTAVDCTPDPLLLGAGPAECAVTVSDTTSTPPVTFLSGVRLTSDMPGSFVANCETLFMATPTQGTCTAPYTPTAAGTHTVTAVYPGDADHDSSQDTDALRVALPGAPPGQPAGPSTASTTNKKKKCKKRKRKHKRSADSAKKKKCKKKKKKPR